MSNLKDEELTVVQETVIEMPPNASTLSKIGETNGKLTFNGESVRDRPTVFMELGENASIYTPDAGHTLRVSDIGGLIPAGTEISSIEVYSEEHGWIDLREAIAIDPNHRGYNINIYKAFEDLEYDAVCCGSIDNSFLGNYLAELALANQLTNARVYYFVERAVSENE